MNANSGIVITGKDKKYDMTATDAIIIFSSTKQLYETTIYREALHLAGLKKIVLFREYHDIPIDRKFVNVSFFRPDTVTKKPRFIRSISSIFHYKKLSSSLIGTFSISSIIIHQDTDFYTNYVLHLIKKKFPSTRIILRRPSPVIEPQSDFSWQRKLWSAYRFLAPFKFFATKVYFDIFLSLLVYGKPQITRQRFWPTNKLFWKKRNQKIYDVSVCYSNKCREYLESMFETSQIIENRLLYKYLQKTNNPEGGAVLFVVSNDLEAIMANLNCTRELAKKYRDEKVNSVARYFIERGNQFHVRSKGDDVIDSIDDDISSHVRFVDSSISLYEQVKDYKNIAGFVTTSLWLLAIYRAPVKIYSFQLLDTPFYNYYSKFPGVHFLKMQSGSNVYTQEMGSLIEDSSTSRTQPIENYI